MPTPDKGDCRSLASGPIAEALVRWRDDTAQRNSKRVYTGESGLLWTKVLRAIADAGRFTNSNDAVVAAHDLAAADRRRTKWREKAQARRALRLARGLVDDDMLREAPAEREERLKSLYAATLVPTADHAMRRWKRETCEFVADTWLAQTMLIAGNKKHGPTHIAEWLTKKDLVPAGVSPGSLRGRVIEALVKVERIMALTGSAAIWAPFDPLQNAGLAKAQSITGRGSDPLQFPARPPLTKSVYT